jgi:glucan phosphoethanolaminetransferase (alkaline phosphatase superfamily)
MDGESPLQYDYVHSAITTKLMNDEKEIEGTAASVEKKRAVRSTNSSRIITMQFIGIVGNVVLFFYALYNVNTFYNYCNTLGRSDGDEPSYQMAKKLQFFTIFYFIYKGIIVILWVFPTKSVSKSLAIGLCVLFTVVFIFEGAATCVRKNTETPFTKETIKNDPFMCLIAFLL